MKIIQTHPQNSSAEERKRQLLSIHSRCIAAIRDTRASNLKNVPRAVAEER